jgi:hypothetical protein
MNFELVESDVLSIAVEDFNQDGFPCSNKLLRLQKILPIYSRHTTGNVAQ